MWTRFLPLAYTLQEKIFEEKVIGDIKTIRADFSMAFYNSESVAVHPRVPRQCRLSTGIQIDPTRLVT